jgi:FAD synthetase
MNAQKKDETPKTVLVFGTFDILHPGHIDFFRQARQAGGHGSKVIVVVAKDFNSKSIKGAFPLNNEKMRLDTIKKLVKDGNVDEAMLGESSNKFKVIEKIKPDIICIGYDQKIPDGFSEWISKQEFSPEIKTLKPYQSDKFKSSKLKGILPQ